MPPPPKKKKSLAARGFGQHPLVPITTHLPNLNQICEFVTDAETLFIIIIIIINSQNLRCESFTQKRGMKYRWH